MFSISAREGRLLTSVSFLSPFAFESKQKQQVEEEQRWNGPTDLFSDNYIAPRITTDR